MLPFKMYNFIKALAFQELHFSNILSNFVLSVLGKTEIYLIFWSKHMVTFWFFPLKSVFPHIDGESCRGDTALVYLLP